MFRGIRSLGAPLLAVLLAGAGLSYAVAQESGETSVDVIQVEPMRGAPEGPEALSPAAQVQAAEAAVASATQSCSAQSNALQSAKKQKDIIRATCVDDKLAQCDANLQNMKRRASALKEANAEGDTGRANHEFTVIGVLSQKFKMLDKAASQCVGQDLFETGDTQVREDVDFFAPDENPAVITVVPDWPVPYIPPPVSGVS
ncbi:MAG: hypothetical protein WBM46_14010 [Polyangiales bacterium]